MITDFIKCYIFFLHLCTPQIFLKLLLLDEEMKRYMGWERSLIQLLLIAFMENNWPHMHCLVLRGTVRPLSDPPKGLLDWELAINFKSLITVLCQAAFHPGGRGKAVCEIHSEMVFARAFERSHKAGAVLDDPRWSLPSRDILQY